MIKEHISRWEMMLGEKIENPNEFLDGVIDAKAGREMRQGMGECYETGYFAQKALDNMFEAQHERTRQIRPSL